MKRIKILILAATMILSFAAYSGAMMGNPGTMPQEPGTMMPTDPGTMPNNPGTMMPSNPDAMPYNPGTQMPGIMPMPTHQEMFNYGPVTDPVMGTTMQEMMPIGVGPVAMGGDMLTIHAAMSQFEGPVDMYMAIYAPSVDPFNVYLIHQNGDIQPTSMGIAPWKENITAVDEIIANIPVSMIPPGNYMLGMMVTPAGGDMSVYYLWTTNFMIQ